jgi:hypothetical protein
LTSANDPSFQGGRSATVTFPYGYMGWMGDYLATAFMLFLQQLSMLLGSGLAPKVSLSVLPTPTLTRPATFTPTWTLTRRPTATPTVTPTATATRRPSTTPTSTWTRRPTLTPTATWTRRPTLTPTATWTAIRTATASNTRTPSRTRTLTGTPTVTATRTQTRTPTLTRTPRPTATPTATIDPATLVTPTPDPSNPTGMGQATGVGPAQKLPSALLVYPLIQADSGGSPRDTRIEMVNITGASISVHCAFIDSVTCSATDFQVFLTAYQPLSWMASAGFRSVATFTAAPPFIGTGELKCAVEARTADLSSHNALQGRALASTSSPSPETIGYTAIGFRRLTPGSYTGSFNLDGNDYEQCPDRLHFNVLASQSGSDSELILVPCTENAIYGGTSTPIGLDVFNEFENSLSGSAALNCTVRRRFSTLSLLRKSTLGTDTGHLIVRGVSVPVIGLVIDRFTGLGVPSVSANEPYLEGGRSAVLQLP